MRYYPGELGDECHDEENATVTKSYIYSNIADVLKSDMDMIIEIIWSDGSNLFAVNFVALPTSALLQWTNTGSVTIVHRNDSGTARDSTAKLFNK